MPAAPPFPRVRGTQILLSLLLLTTGGVAGISPALAGEPNGPLAGFAAQRTWSDRTGNFEIEAVLVFADAQSVRLKKTDQRVVTVPLNKLSDADQNFIRGFLKAAELLGEGDPANPFAGGDIGGSPSGGEASRAMRETADATLPEVAPGNELTVVEPVVKGFRPMTLTPNQPFWSADPPLPFPDVTFEDYLAELEMPKPFFGSMRVLAAGRSGTIVLNTYRQGRKPEENWARFAVLDVSAGTTSATREFDQPWKLMAITPDASRVAAVRIEGFDKGNDVAIFRIQGGNVVPEFQFKAGGGSWDELHWVGFLPDNRLATISQKHHLTFWDLSNPQGPKAIRRGPSGGSLVAELTPAADLLALPFGTSIAVVETQGGKLVGCMTRDEAATQLAFSPDASMLAAFHPFNLSLYSTSDGSLIRTIPVSESGAKASLTWQGNRHVKVGPVLYDVERGVPLWSYEGRPAVQTSLGPYLISGFGNDDGSKVSVLKVPHDEALRIADSIDPETIYALRPGDPISIVFQLGSAPPAAQQAIRSAVQEKLSALGWKVSESALHTMTIELLQGDVQEAEYYTRRGFGPIFAPPGFGPPPSGPADKVQYRPWTHTVTITAGDQEVFTNRYVRSAPQNLSTEDGESTQAAVLRICQPTPSYFSNLAIPPSLLKAEYQGGLGKSNVTGEGLR